MNQDLDLLISFPQPIKELLLDDSVSEIMGNPNGQWWFERRGKLEHAEVVFDAKALRTGLEVIANKLGRKFDESHPLLNAQLPDGSRLAAVLPPVVRPNPAVTIRKFSKARFTIADLIQGGAMTPEVGATLSGYIEAGKTMLISGGTGSGKTTFLNALSNFIPKDERIITIEDSAELMITSIDNIVRMETRNSNTEGKGEITIRELIKSSLRMRPERIIVGEVRGGEALDMLQALNTGHDGSLSTGHANSCVDMLSRLETMVLSGAPLPLDAIRQQIASAIDIIIHLSRLRDRSRRTMEISEVVGYREGQIILNPLYIFEDEGDTQDKKVKGSLKRTANSMIHTFKFKMAGISEKV